MSVVSQKELKELKKLIENDIQYYYIFSYRPNMKVDGTLQLQLSTFLPFTKDDAKAMFMDSTIGLNNSKINSIGSSYNMIQLRARFNMERVCLIKTNDPMEAEDIETYINSVRITDPQMLQKMQIGGV